MDGDQVVNGGQKDAGVPKRKYLSGWEKKKAKREKQRQLVLATLTVAGRERIDEVLPPAQMPQTLADVAHELRRVFWESRMRLIPDDVASHQSYCGMQALRATEAEVQTSQISEYLQRMKEPRQPQVTAYKYGTDIALVEQAEAQQP